MINIYIAENGAVRNSVFGTAIVSALVCDFDIHKNLRQAINQIIAMSGEDPYKMTMRWSEVTEKNEHVYKNVLTVLNKIPNVRYFGIAIRKFEAKKLNTAYVQLIRKIMQAYPEETNFRIFVLAKNFLPYKYTKNIQRLLGEDVSKTEIFTVQLAECRMTQCADVIGGAILYFKRDDQYLVKMGTHGKAEVVFHGLNMKKQPGKFNLFDYEEE